VLINAVDWAPRYTADGNRGILISVYKNITGCRILVN